MNLAPSVADSGDLAAAIILAVFGYLSLQSSSKSSEGAAACRGKSSHDLDKTDPVSSKCFKVPFTAPSES